MEIKVGMKCKQIKAIKEYEFDYVGNEFNITKSSDTLIVGKGVSIGVGFGIDTVDFLDYFEMIVEQKDVQNSAVNEDGLKVIRNGYVTIVVLPDGCMGVSNCLPNDKYDPSKGFDIAHTKAKIKSLEKHLRVLSK